MRKLSPVMAVAVLLLCLGLQAEATVLTFDDVTAGIAASIPDGYGGFNWDQFSVIHGDSYPGTGYDNGTVSGDYAAFNDWGKVATVGDDVFAFGGAWLTAAWTDGLSVKVDGYLDATLVHTQTVVVDTSAPTWFDFNYTGVNRLEFASWKGQNTGLGYQFVMDNFTFNDVIPEPATVSLLGLGALALARRRRRR